MGSTMRILEFHVSGLFGREGLTSWIFGPDVNILTGRNGAGKTTILKLIWYTMSGNIDIALREVQFSEVRLKTTDYEVNVRKISRTDCEIKFIDDTGDYFFQDISDGDEFTNYAEDQAKEHLIDHGASVFFPTFRRIEGGFSTGVRSSAGALSSYQLGRQGELGEALASVSRRLSKGRHTFVSSMSTSDLRELLLKQYGSLSQKSSELQSHMSQEMISKIKAYQDAAQSQIRADALIDEIKKDIERMETDRLELFSALNAVENLTSRILRHKGIQFEKKIGFGEAAEAINSDLLSAGEKQFLSFLFYNAFTRDAVILIDEPELSLHVDWQRILLSTLRSQSADNQFVVATHSPFIYGSYPERELALSDDRGFDSE